MTTQTESLSQADTEYRQEIISMAKQAGACADGRIWLMYSEDLEAFAKLVASAASVKEREACAQICLNAAAHLQKFNAGSLACCDAIRARGEPTLRGEA